MTNSTDILANHGGRRNKLGAALAGLAAPVAAPTAPLPPVAIVHDLRPRQVVTRDPRAVPKTPAPLARAYRAKDKRAAKHAYRAARRRGRPVGWRKAHEHAEFRRYLMSGGSRAVWADVHARMAGVV